MAAVRFWLVVGLWSIAACFALGDDPPPNDDRELHVVGLYEGATRTGGEIHGPRATVTVDRPGRRVTLVLACHVAVTWNVTVTAGTSLEQVIIGGGGPHVVNGLPSTTKIVKASRQGGEGSGPLGFCYQLDTPEFRSFLFQLGKLTSQEVSSFHGAYRPESPFLIDAIQNEPKLLRSYPQATPLKELPELKFAAVHVVAQPGRGGFGDWRASYGDFTLGGPDSDSLRPLPKDVRRVAYDPGNRKLYGIAGNAPVEVDLERQQKSKLEVGLDVPPIGNVQGITFDTQRGRLLVATGGRDSYLYAYDVAAKKWSVLAEKLEVSSLAYHAKSDCLYGIAAPLIGRGGPPLLRQFEASGSLIREYALGESIVPGSLGGRGPLGNGTQVVPVGEHIVIFAMPEGHRSSEDEAPPSTYMYLFDPKAGKSWLTWKN